MERVLLGEFNGTVKWFNAQKGYGFIRRNSGEEGPDIFVHHTAIKMEGFRTLHDGEHVRYELYEGPKGLQAMNVVPA
jgi:CspA family cold shock protein